MRPDITVMLLMAGIAAMPRAVCAQSLADVARQEGERRKTLQNEGKTLTNSDLVPVASTAAASPAPAPAADGTKSDDKDAKDDAADKDKAPGAAAKDTAKPKDQKYWSERMKALNGKVAEDKVLADAMQTRVNALTADFVNRDDPAQRAVIASDRQKALDELSRLKQAIADDSKAIADAEEEARKANVPPGWLR